MTTMRNRLTKCGAFVRGVMIGLALNLSILPMVQAQHVAAPDTVIGGSVESAVTLHKVEPVVLQLFQELRESTVARVQSELDADCPECGLDSLFATQSQLFARLFAREADAHELALHLDRSLVENGHAELAASDTEQALIAAISGAEVIDFESGVVPLDFPADLTFLASVFTSVAWMTAAVQHETELLVVRGVELAWRADDGTIRCAFAPIELVDPDQSPPTEAGGWAYRLRCGIAAVAFAAALTLCVGCVSTCLAGGAGCACVAAACCLAFGLFPATLQLCRARIGSESLVALYAIAAGTCAVLPWAVASVGATPPPDSDPGRADTVQTRRQPSGTSADPMLLPGRLP